MTHKRWSYLLFLLISFISSVISNDDKNQTAISTEESMKTRAKHPFQLKEPSKIMIFSSQNSSSKQNRWLSPDGILYGFEWTSIGTEFLSSQWLRQERKYIYLKRQSFNVFLVRMLGINYLLYCSPLLCDCIKNISIMFKYLVGPIK